ncbi:MULTISPECIES: HAMP domain-containing sensor histidine kinase [Corynebacterium]|uniref:HAMP domain-containing sensor histidine kinase n=1 Tax=Corynebacterium TaxID=1716 RepID=UPI00257E4CB6|nr:MULTISPECIES: HAMP domain-containing sensor histidine kinase [Corynebacterium]MDN6686572.1 HAMP domain-containing histidine kinase [Corynebacterium flavescens]
MIFTQRTGEEAEGSGVHELTADSGPAGSNTSAQSEDSEKESSLSPARILSRFSLKLRLSLITGIVVALSVALMASALYFLISASLMSFGDSGLEKRADVMLERTKDPEFVDNLSDEFAKFRDYTANTRISYIPPGQQTSLGDDIPVHGAFERGSDGLDTVAFSEHGERIVAKRDSSGATVVIARDMERINYLVYVIGPILIVVVVLGILVAMVAGAVVARAGMQPIARLRQAADYVTRTNDLRPIEVVGKDELAQLTVSFNRMLQSLEKARLKQRQFVADAGHELKTPLTSMRTNIELLMMMEKDRSRAPISRQEREDLESDVMSQMSELSNLIGDLVDLTREDAVAGSMGTVELHEILETSLERVRRRRPDVEFQADIEPWNMDGDPLALGRATLNLFDNAAKWSPAQGTVYVSLNQVSENRALLRVDDSGPGIDPEEREKVFERFYRAAAARSMPGSGIGLAIVKAVVERHHGSIEISSSADGGARMDVLLPGKPGVIGQCPEEGAQGTAGAEETGAAEPAPTTSPRARAFVKRWFDRL